MLSMRGGEADFVSEKAGLARSERGRLTVPLSREASIARTLLAVTLK